MKSFILIAISVWMPLLTIPTQAQSLTDDVRLKMISELVKLRKEAETRESTAAQAKMAWLMEAALSDLSAAQSYEKAVRQAQFEGMKGETAEFKAWREKNEEALKKSETRAAIRFHLRYLMLTLKRSADAEPEILIPELARYANELDEVTDIARDHPMLKEPFVQGAIAKALDIMMPKEAWVDQAGNTAGMYQKLILPFWREKKDVQLLTYWKNRIEREGAAAKETRLDQKITDFETRQKPTLAWNYAQELLVLGREKEALGEMFTIVMNAQSHPSFESWAAELEKRLKGDQ
jgi:hypothetical protein